MGQGCRLVLMVSGTLVNSRMMLRMDLGRKLLEVLKFIEDSLKMACGMELDNFCSQRKGRSIKVDSRMA